MAGTEPLWMYFLTGEYCDVILPVHQLRGPPQPCTLERQWRLNDGYKKSELLLSQWLENVISSFSLELKQGLKKPATSPPKGREHSSDTKCTTIVIQHSK